MLAKGLQAGATRSLNGPFVSEWFLTLGIVLMFFRVTIKKKLFTTTPS